MKKKFSKILSLLLAVTILCTAFSQTNCLKNKGYAASNYTAAEVKNLLASASESITDIGMYATTNANTATITGGMPVIEAAIAVYDYAINTYAELGNAWADYASGYLLAEKMIADLNITDSNAGAIITYTLLPGYFDDDSIKVYNYGERIHNGTVVDKLGSVTAGDEVGDYNYIKWDSDDYNDVTESDFVHTLTVRLSETGKEDYLNSFGSGNLPDKYISQVQLSYTYSYSRYAVYGENSSDPFGFYHKYTAYKWNYLSSVTYTPSYSCNTTVSSQKHPDGYNFHEDSYDFENYSAVIPLGYFRTMYGNAKGYELWKNKWFQSGLCFGFAYTTAAFYNGLPSCNSIRGLSDSSTINIGNNSLSVATYIKYAHIYQYSMEFKNNSYWSTALLIYDLVKKCTADNNLLVTIGMTHATDGGHRVLAVGIDGNDILIDDSNNKNALERLTVNPDGSWSFSGLSGWNSNTCRIRYSLDYYGPYKFISTLKPLTVNEAFIDDSTIDSLSISLEADTLSKDYLLLGVDSEAYTISNTDISKIESEYSEGTEATDTSDFYWVGTDTTVTLTDISENSDIELAGNETIIGVSTANSKTVSLTLDENNDDINTTLETTSGNKYTVSTTTFDDTANAITLSVTGIANGSKITSEQTDTGLLITGISDGTITLSVADEVVATQNISSDENHNIEISYDANDESEDLAVAYTHTETDENHDGICNICGEDFSKNCSCLCHSSNGFFKFLHEVLTFICKLFSIEDYHYCDCGKAHW